MGIERLIGKKVVDVWTETETTRAMIVFEGGIRLTAGTDFDGFACLEFDGPGVGELEEKKRRKNKTTPETPVANGHVESEPEEIETATAK